MSDTTTAAAQRDKLMADLKVVVADAEQLLQLTAGQVGENATALRERLQERLTAARLSMADLGASVGEKAKAAGHAADDYVHEHPWQSVAIGAGVGLVVGLLIGRR